MDASGLFVKGNRFWRPALPLSVFVLLTAYGASISPAAENLLLDTSANWRAYYLWRPVLYGSRTNCWRVAEEGSYANSPVPPTNWICADFDDRSWHLTRGPLFDGYGFEQPQELAQLCLRAKFELRDSDTNRCLSLSVRYRGGALVYVNGQEIARSYMPEGPILPDTLALDYPYEAYTTFENRPIRSERMHHLVLKDRLELRIRDLQNVIVPGNVLRVGMNVLAFQLHRTAMQNLPKSFHTDWSTLGFLGAQLKSYPKGFVLWNANALSAVREQEYGDSFSALAPISLVGPRNGVCSGQVIASSRETIRGFRATCSDLRSRDSSAIISSNEILIRYASFPPRPSRLIRSQEPEPYFDGLLADPPREITIQPVWLTVHIPASTPAGAYTGSLTIGAGNGQTNEVPVSLRVSDWTLPPPSNFTAHLGLFQSPDSIALKFGVPLWSDAHFRLMEKSFELLGTIGNKTIVLPLLCQTHLGNEESMVRWIRRADGSHEPDFSVLEQYLDLCQKHLPNASVVCLYVWEQFMGSDQIHGFNYDSAVNLQFKTNGIPVTAWDPSKGESSTIDGPNYGTPESRAFWQPALDGVRARLNSRGWDDRRIMLGIIADRWPTKQVVDFFKEVAPYATWAMHCHPISTTNVHGAAVRHAATAIAEPMDFLDTTPLHGRHRSHGWSLDWEKTVFPRGPLSKLKRPYLLSVYTDPAAYRNVIEGALLCGYRGVARLGFDFWDLPGTIANSGRDPFRRGFNVAGRYPLSSWGSLSLGACVHHLVVPGPDGAVATVRFEMLREGLQESEARIFIEKALCDEAVRGRLSADLLKRAEKVLDDRLNAWLIGSMCWDWFIGSGWQERARLLFEVAGEVSEALESGSPGTVRPTGGGTGDGSPYRGDGKRPAG
jgi:hypothetical protein